MKRDLRDRLVLVIAPERFDRPDRDREQARAEAAADADVMVGTEATGLPFNVPGWTATRGKGPHGESYVAVSERFTVIKRGAEQVTSGNGRGRFTNPTYCPWMVARDNLSGFVLIPIGEHQGAHNFPGSRLYHPANIRSWWEGMRGTKRLRRRLRKAYPGAAMLKAGDPNAVRQTWYRQVVGSLWPKAAIGWGGPFSSAVLWGLRVVRVTTIDPGRASDHPWKRVVIEYRPRLLSPRPVKENR